MALRKSGTCCSKKSASGLLFDGDQNSAVNMYEHCFGQFFLDINLAGFFVINYVVVYAGNGTSSRLIGIIVVNSLIRLIQQSGVFISYP